jgi:predicted esterase
LAAALAATALAAAALAACSDSATGKPDGDAGTAADAPAVAIGPASALFTLPRAGASAEFYSLPFPNDLRRKSDGTLDLAGLAPYTDGIPLLQQYMDIFSRKFTGFGTNQAVYFRFSGGIDRKSLPAGPADTRGAGASVYLVVVDPGPHLGERIPVLTQFNEAAGASIGANWLALLPYPGFPLRSLTTYAAVVTRRVKANDGTAVTRSADFTALVGASSSDATVMAAQKAYKPLVDFLGNTAMSTDRVDDVVAAAVFTTQDTTSFVGKLRTAVYATDAPTPTSVVPTDSHTSFQTYEGTYSAPNFQSGTVPYFSTGGEILVDDNGKPKVDHYETLRFAATFPKGKTMPDKGWPLVIYAHGTGGNYRSFIDDGTAGRLAQQGLAAVSIDQVLHGPRDPTGHDPDITFFNFVNPLAARDNVRQGALDQFSLLRMAVRLNPAGNTIDENKLYFFGHSQGGLSGPLFLAFEPRVKAAVLSGAGALIYIALLGKTEPVDVTVFVQTQIKDTPLDYFNPMLALIQMYIEPADPANYGPLLTTDALKDVGAKDIYQSEGFVDHDAPDPGIEALGVSMSLTPVGPLLHDVPGFALRNVSPTMPPIMSNLQGKTGVFAQYDAGPKGEGHFVVFDIPAAQRQSASFLGTLAATGVATLVP